MIDESSEFGARVARRLREERVVWLTSVTPGGSPIPSPVWFWWDGEETVHMLSLPDTPRTRNLRANGKVALNFDGNGQGGDIVVLQGEATVGEGGEAPGPYVEKYESGFQRLGLTAEQFQQRYSVPLTIRLTRVRGH